MKEFIEKLIERLEEEKEKAFSQYRESFELYREEFWRGRMGGFTNAISIVNQLAEEYNNDATKTDYDSIIKFIESEIERTTSFSEHDTQINIMNYVQQLQEKNNNGWIPCSERLPEEEGYYLITMKYYHLHNPIVMGCNFENGEWWNIEKDDEVIAWMPLPEPYKPKQNGVSNENTKDN